MRPALHPLAALALAAVALVVPASAVQAASPRAVGRLPLVAGAGGQIELTLKVSGGASQLGLVLSRSTRTAKRGIKLGGRGARVRAGGTRRVRIRVSIPASVPQGKRLTLFACANVAAGVRSGKGCRALGKIPTSGPGLQQRLDAAVAAHRLSRGQALLYGLYAMNKDPRLPLELRAKGAGPAGVEGLVRDAALHADSLPSSVRRRLIWYFVPPAGKGSAWRGVAPRGHKAATLIAHAADSSSGTTCQGYQALSDSPYSGADRAPWVGVPTTDGHAIVWYQESDGRAQAAARSYARMLPEIWSKLTREFQMPKSDANEHCFHGPDGRFDVYVSGVLTWLAAGAIGSSGAAATSAITMPYPLAHGRWCTDRPAWIAIDPGKPRSVLAHELMHAIQFSYRYATCDNVAWWDEGGANWAADFVYPHDHYAPEGWPQWVGDPLGQDSISKGSYEAFPLWLMLQRTLGTGVLRQIFAKLGSMSSVPAVNAAIPGGFKRQWPRFAVHVYNQRPVGTLGFEIGESFAAWDDWRLTPLLSRSPDLTLNGAGERTIGLPNQNPRPNALTIDAYHRVAIPDHMVREVRFKNGALSAGVLAMLQLADGSWKLQDWSGRQTVTLCRDKPDEDVQQLVIVTANTSQTASLPAAFKHELRGRNACQVPSYSGTFSGSAFYGTLALGDGTATATWNGTVTLTPATEDELRGYTASTLYRITAGHVTYDMHGHFGGCDATASTSFGLPTLDTQALGLLEVYPGDPKQYSLLVGMPLSQSTTGTRSNCEDSSQNGPFLWLLPLGAPALISTGQIAARTTPIATPITSGPILPVPASGVLAGVATSVATPGVPADQSWTWSLTPSG